MESVSATQIIDSLRALADKSVPSVRALRRKWSFQLRNVGPRSVISLARSLVRQGSVERWVAYELVCCHPSAIEELRPADVLALGRGISGWGEVDAFGCLVSGLAWREGRIPDAMVMNWAKSSDRWWRRAALVSTIPLNLDSRGGTGDPARTLPVCAMLVADHDDMVVKALSWALRALSVRDPAAVESFLSEHRDVVAARVRREVRNKIDTGVKNPGQRTSRTRPHSRRRGDQR